MAVGKVNPDLYVGSTGKQLKDIKTNADNISNNASNITNILTRMNTKVSITNLYSNTPSAGNIGKLSAPGSKQTINGNFSDYDYIVIGFSSRVWGWCKHTETIWNHGQFGDSSINTGNLFTVVMPEYAGTSLFTMQYYFTNNNTVTVYANNAYTNDNHLYIQYIDGVKILPA